MNGAGGWVMCRQSQPQLVVHETSTHICVVMVTKGVWVVYVIAVA